MRELKFRRPIYQGKIFTHFFLWGEREDGFISPPDYPLPTKPDEQYIGIKDCDDDGIYEGHVVRLSFNDEAGLIGKVIYDPKRASFRVQVLSGHYVSDWTTYENIKIIGNIHQNPELLK
jgi:hypothetical protein